MTPRVATPPRRGSGSTFADWRENGARADLEARAFWNYVAAPALWDGESAIELLAQDERQLLEERRVLSKASSGGGLLVPTDLAAAIASAARAAAPVAQVAAEFLTDTGETLNLAVGGTHGTAAWTAESGSYTPSDETITQQALGAFKGTSKIIVSEELRGDEAVDLDAYLAAELGARLGALQAAAFASGDGSGKPLGLTTAGNGISVVTAATGSATSFKLADLVAVFKAVPAAYRATSSWLIAADDFASLAALTDSAGSLVLPSLQFDPPSLFGRPVYIDGYLPAPAANAKSIVFGDFKLGYGVRRVRDLGLQRQDQLHSDNGQVGFKAFARTDGRVLLADALRILQHSTT